MIYFVRHGQTDDNANGNLLTGWSATPLNERGFAQARETAAALKDIKFDVCFCSPLLRTRQTLEEILKFHEGLSIIFDDRLKERDYGEITGKPASICKFRRWNANDEIPFEMESIPKMYQRVSSFYDEILPKTKGKNVLIVAHSGVGRLSYFYFNGKPEDNDYSNFQLDNAKVIEFEN
ncbi:MAG: histidine phosphatase family protein [Clostridia bacterium]|jgi:broad specificity phosphatase PhoE|nr:histidine phosphatase family protein [Clostridia bacterium]